MEDSGDEWEETTVVVALSGIIDRDWAANVGEKCKILGIESEQPIMQLDRYIFTGEYQDAVGTHVLFEQTESDDNDSDDGDDDSGGPRPKLEYRWKTHKKLCMKRAFLVEKDDDSSIQELVDASQKNVKAQGPRDVSMETTSSVPEENVGATSVQTDSAATVTISDSEQPTQDSNDNR